MTGFFLVFNRIHASNVGMNIRAKLNFLILFLLGGIILSEVLVTYFDDDNYQIITYLTLMYSGYFCYAKLRCEHCSTHVLEQSFYTGLGGRKLLFWVGKKCSRCKKPYDKEGPHILKIILVIYFIIFVFSILYQAINFIFLV